MLLCGELLQQILVGGVRDVLTGGQSVTQPVLMGKQQPDLPTPAFGNTCTERAREQELTENTAHMYGYMNMTYMSIYSLQLSLTLLKHKSTHTDTQT